MNFWILGAGFWGNRETGRKWKEIGRARWKEREESETSPSVSKIINKRPPFRLLSMIQHQHINPRCQQNTIIHLINHRNRNTTPSQVNQKLRPDCITLSHIGTLQHNYNNFEIETICFFPCVWRYLKKVKQIYYFLSFFGTFLGPFDHCYTGWNLQITIRTIWCS